MDKKNLTIADIAEELGVSKTTVSRAISGKGRIGETTKKRVLDYVKQINYKPNVIAQGLAKSRTYNIGVVMPKEYYRVNMPYFLTCMEGIHEIAVPNGYDILLTVSDNMDWSNLEKVVTRGKVDGLILMRTYKQDHSISYLKENKVPFVAIGSCEDKSVIQIDQNHEDGCCKLTTVLIQQGFQKIGLIGGNEEYIVNQRRLRGFQKAFYDTGKTPEKVYMNADHTTAIEQGVNEMIRQGVDCIICMDDSICAIVKNKLEKDKIDIPNQIAVASFFNGPNWENGIGSITCLAFDIKQQGKVAAQSLLSLIEGRKSEDITLSDYNIVLKSSTNR